MFPISAAEEKEGFKHKCCDGFDNRKEASVQFGPFWSGKEYVLALHFWDGLLGGFFLPQTSTQHLL